MSLKLIMKSRLIEGTNLIPHHVVLYKRCEIHDYREKEDRTEIIYITWIETADSAKSHGLNGDRCWGHYMETPTEGLQDFLDRCKRYQTEPELWSR